MGGQSHPWLRSGTRLAQASLDPGEVTGWDVGDPALTCSLPIAFLPKSFYHQPLFKPYPPSFQPYPTPRLSSPTLPLVFQASPTPYPIVFPAPPTTPYPLSFTTSCFHEFEASQPMSFTHPRRLQKRIQSRAERDKSEDSGKEVFKACAQNISWNFTETTSYYPTQCLSTRRRRGKNEIKKNRKNATKRNLQVEEEKNPQKSFRRGSGVAT